MKRRKDDTGGMNLENLLQEKEGIFEDEIPELDGIVEPPPENVPNATSAEPPSIETAPTESEPTEAAPTVPEIESTVSEPVPPVPEGEPAIPEPEPAIPEPEPAMAEAVLKATPVGPTGFVQTLVTRLNRFQPGDLVELVEIEETTERLLQKDDLTDQQRQTLRHIIAFDGDDEEQAKRLGEKLKADFTTNVPASAPAVQPTSPKQSSVVTIAADVLHSFLQESHDHLEDMEQRILDLESNPSPDLINAVFRAAHTIKGTSSLIGFSAIEGLSHGLEALLDDLRDGKLAVGPDLVDVLLAGSDRLGRMIGELESESASAPVEDGKVTIGNRGTDIGDLIDRLENVRNSAGPDWTDELVTPEMIEKFVSESSDMLDAMEKDILELEHNTGDRSLLDNVFRTVHTIKGNAGFLGYHQIEQVCMATENLLDRVRREETAVNDTFTNSLLRTVDAIRNLLNAVPEKLPSLPGISESDSPNPDRPLGEILLNMGVVTQETLDAALETQERRLGEILIEEGKVPREILESALESQKKVTVAGGERFDRVTRKDIRVDMVRLDRLFDLVGELITSEAMVIDHTAVQGIDDDSYDKAISYLSKVSREMQEITMTLRMIPLEGLFNKMNRLVRDLSKRFGKKIHFRVSGTDTEMDRKVIEMIADPLVHIIRNAIDHGLEDKETRKLRGKPEIGTVRLNAKYEGNEIWVTVSDDGGGLDRTRILDQAIERGLIEGDVEELTDQDVWSLIFEPGFSTSESVSEISGRGVGMDVVKKNLDRLRGTVTIGSVKTMGTEIILKIPMTLAIIDGVTARISDTLLAIPIGDVLEFQKAEREHITGTDADHDVLRMREEMIPVIYPHEFFGISQPEGYTWGGIFVVVQSGGRKVALLADEILGYRQIVVKALPEFMGVVRAISGCSVLGNGEVSLILDTSALVRETLE